MARLERMGMMDEYGKKVKEVIYRHHTGELLRLGRPVWDILLYAVD